MSKTIEIPDFDSVKAEQNLLATILTYNDSLYDIEDRIKPEHFSRPEHKQMYVKILELHGNGQGFDFISLLNQKFDPDYVEGLASLLINSYSIHTYVDSILENYVKRKYTEIGSEIISKAIDMNASELSILAEEKILEAGHACSESKTEHVSDSLLNIQQEVDKNMDRPASEKMALGIMSGIIAIDRFTYGFKKGKVYVLAGRPSAGKTATLTSMTDYIAVKCKIPTAVYSLEMESEELLYRAISTNSQVPCQNIELGDLTDEQYIRYSESVRLIHESPMYINQKSGHTAKTIRSDLKRLIKEKGIKIAFIDYLGLLDGEGKDNYHKVTKLSNDIRKIAKDLDIPIVLLCQLNRAVESRGGKAFEPNTSDLRDSGAIEQDAYAIIFIDRPEMRDPDNPELKGLGKFITAKNRGGKTGKADVRFIGETYTFKDID